MRISSRSIWAGIALFALILFSTVWSLSSGGSQVLNSPFTVSVHVVGADAGCVNVPLTGTMTTPVSFSLPTVLQPHFDGTNSTALASFLHSPANLSGGAVASADLSGARGVIFAGPYGSTTFTGVSNGSTNGVTFINGIPTLSFLDRHMYPCIASTSGGAVCLNLANIYTSDLYGHLWDGVDPGFGLKARALNLPNLVPVYLSHFSSSGGSSPGSNS